MSQTLVIYRSNCGRYRITEHIDMCFDMENLKGDCFNPSVNTDIDPNTLENEERQFEDRVNNEGVYGYVLEKWNPAPDKGWEHIDSCWGFVGRHTAKNTHYIVAEMKGTIADDMNKQLTQSDSTAETKE